jgi:hypothetical protein
VVQDHLEIAELVPAFLSEDPRIVGMRVMAQHMELQELLRIPFHGGWDELLSSSLLLSGIHKTPHEFEYGTGMQVLKKSDTIASHGAAARSFAQKWAGFDERPFAPYHRKSRGFLPVVRE